MTNLRNKFEQNLSQIKTSITNSNIFNELNLQNLGCNVSSVNLGEDNLTISITDKDGYQLFDMTFSLDFGKISYFNYTQGVVEDDCILEALDKVCGIIDKIVK